MFPFRILTALGLVIMVGCVSTSAIRGLDDPLQDKVEISTDKFSHGLVWRPTDLRGFFRGYVHKTTKAVTHQMCVYSLLAGGFPRWDRIAFIKGGKVRKEILGKRIAFNFTAGQRVNCYHEDTLFIVSIADIEWISQQKKAVFRLSSTKTQKMVDFDILGVEAKFYLDKLKEVNKSLK